MHVFILLCVWQVLESPDDPVALALEWELDDPDARLPKEKYHCGITWVPARKSGRGKGAGKKGRLADKLRVRLVKMFIERVKKEHVRMQEAGLISATSPSLALYGERGEGLKQYHAQGYVCAMSNGGAVVVQQMMATFLIACMPIHAEVMNDLQVKLVGPSSSSSEPDQRSVPVCCFYPIKEMGLPHSYGFDDYSDEFREHCRTEGKNYYSQACLALPPFSPFP